MKASEILQKIKSGHFDSAFQNVYSEKGLKHQKKRAAALAEKYIGLYGDTEDTIVLTAPGRTEIGGNHTDHNHGLVLAGAVTLDILGIAAPSGNSLARLKSEHFDEDVADLSVLSPVKAEEGKSVSLIRGMAAQMAASGYQIGGFTAYTTSDVLQGSGLSSSAAFEVLTGNIFSHLFNQGKVSAQTIALFSQAAENQFFGKPCGLMDQMACSCGGLIAIDFNDPENARVQEISFDLSSTDYTLCIVDTRGSHQDLTGEYAAVPAEMKAVAKLMGCDVLRDASLEKVLNRVSEIREKLGDRALLRAIHYFNDNERVKKQTAALENKDIEAFLALVKESGRSSFMYLQNVYADFDNTHQSVSVALCLSDQVLGNRGAFRVHGGGFAGTIQAYVPFELLDAYQSAMEALFGKGCCYLLGIRKQGGTRII